MAAVTAVMIGLVVLAPATSSAGGPDRLVDLDQLADEGPLGPGPAGWLNYCLAAPARCGQSLPRARVSGPEGMGLVARVQREVNARITPRPEPPTRDAWVVGPGAGDCEDFALTKQAALRAAGLPPGALRLATAYTERGEYHTVLTVQTDRGTLVLDNRFADALPVAVLPYRWVMVERPDRPFAWSRLDGVS